MVDVVKNSLFHRKTFVHSINSTEQDVISRHLFKKKCQIYWTFTMVNEVATFYFGEVFILKYWRSVCPKGFNIERYCIIWLLWRLGLSKCSCKMLWISNFD